MESWRNKFTANFKTWKDKACTGPVQGHRLMELWSKMSGYKQVGSIHMALILQPCKCQEVKHQETGHRTRMRPKAIGVQMTDMELQDLVFVQAFLARPLFLPFWVRMFTLYDCILEVYTTCFLIIQGPVKRLPWILQETQNLCFCAMLELLKLQRFMGLENQWLRVLATFAEDQRLVQHPQWAAHKSW